MPAKNCSGLRASARAHFAAQTWPNPGGIILKLALLHNLCMAQVLFCPKLSLNFRRACMNDALWSERELLERARQHDEPAFRALVEHYTPTVFRIVQRMVPDRMEAEALVQETFWRFWQVLPRYSSDRPLLPYLATIVSNLARDRFRRDHRLQDVPLDDLPEGRAGEAAANLEQVVDDRRVLRLLADHVRTLPLAYRMVISLRYEADMSYEEIATALSLPLNTVRTHLRRAKQILRRQLEETENG